MNTIYDEVCRDLNYWPPIIIRFVPDHLEDQYSRWATWAAYTYPVINDPKAFAKINGVMV